MRTIDAVLRLKRIDYYVQISCYLAAMFYGFLLFNALQLFDMIPFYLLLGGYQLISALLTALSPVKRSRLRKIYYAILVVLFATVVAALYVNTFFYIGGFIMLFASPVVAVFYTYICHLEISAQKTVTVGDQLVNSSEPPTF